MYCLFVFIPVCVCLFVCLLIDCLCVSIRIDKISKQVNKVGVAFFIVCLRKGSEQTSKTSTKNTKNKANKQANKQINQLKCTRTKNKNIHTQTNKKQTNTYASVRAPGGARARKHGGGERRSGGGGGGVAAALAAWGLPCFFCFF